MSERMECAIELDHVMRADATQPTALVRDPDGNDIALSS